MVAGRTTRNPSTLGVSLVIQRWGEVIFDELWRLEWRLARTERAHRRPMNVPMEEMESVREKAMRKVNTLKHLIESTKSSRLLSRANRLGLPTPDFNMDYEDEDETWESGHLTRTEQSDLRSRISVEEKERREAVAFWVKDVLVPVLSVVIGIFGATAGLIALLRK
jgi:hypothetical protein